MNRDATTDAGDISAIRTKPVSPLSTPLPADADHRLDVDGSNTLTASDSIQIRRELVTALGTLLSLLPQVTAPAKLSARSFATLSREEEKSTLATGLSVDA